MSDSLEERETNGGDSMDLESVLQDTPESDEEFLSKFRLEEYRPAPQLKNSKEKVSGRYGTFLYCAIVLVLTILLWTFVLAPMEIIGDSMKNTLYHGDTVVIFKLGVQRKGPKRYEIVVAEVDGVEDRVVKRVIALPGEAVYVDDEGIIHVFSSYSSEGYAEGEEILLKEPFNSTGGFRGMLGTKENPLCLGDEEYLLLGDNRSISKDGRSFGPVRKKQIIGRVVFRMTPLKRFGKVR